MTLDSFPQLQPANFRLKSCTSLQHTDFRSISDVIALTPAPRKCELEPVKSVLGLCTAKRPLLSCLEARVP